MTPTQKPGSTAVAPTGDGSSRFATLTFERNVAAPVSVLWQAWTAPAARAVWAAPTPAVEVAFLEADTRIGGREVSLCRWKASPTFAASAAGWSCSPHCAA